MVKGGAGALTAAMADAAREAGAEIRTGAAVSRILVRDGRVAGVVLEDGAEIPADAVIANTDPKLTLLHFVDPVDLDPGFIAKVRNYRMPGMVAKLDFALSALPSFRAVPRTADCEADCTLAEHRLPGARLRCVEYGDSWPNRISISRFPRCSTPRWHRQDGT